MPSCKFDSLLKTNIENCQIKVKKTNNQQYIFNISHNELAIKIMYTKE